MRNNYNKCIMYMHPWGRTSICFDNLRSIWGDGSLTKICVCYETLTLYPKIFPPIPPNQSRPIAVIKNKEFITITIFTMISYEMHVGEGGKRTFHLWLRSTWKTGRPTTKPVVDVRSGRKLPSSLNSATMAVKKSNIPVWARAIHRHCLLPTK